MNTHFLDQARQLSVEDPAGVSDSVVGRGQDISARTYRTVTLQCVVLVAKQPKLYTVVYKGICHSTAKLFPYSVYFRAETQLIIILAVFNGSRDPTIWQGEANG